LILLFTFFHVSAENLPTKYIYYAAAAFPRP